MFFKDSGVLPYKYHEKKYNVPSDNITLPCYVHSASRVLFLGFFSSSFNLKESLSLPISGFFQCNVSVS